MTERRKRASSLHLNPQKYKMSTSTTEGSKIEVKINNIMVNFETGCKLNPSHIFQLGRFSAYTEQRKVCAHASFV
jgi:hypothetical protein